MGKIILTGDRPTGKLHLGHYIGSLQRRVQLQNAGDFDKMFVFMADVQALTDNADNPEKIRQNIIEVALDYLSAGLDPQKCTLYIQSMIPELAELTTYLMNLITVSRVQRNPTVKTEIKMRNFEANIPLGFFCYPVSQAADITAFKATTVPAGEDQEPMLEVTRELVRRFNQVYAPVLVEPEILLPENAVCRRLPGTDGKEKMSKSLGNCIYLSDDEKTVWKKVKKMSNGEPRMSMDEPGHLEGNAVFTYMEAFSTDEDFAEFWPEFKNLEELKEQYVKGGGSLTALPIIETQAGDVSAYIPTNVISITDGQIFLETDLFNQGFRPAINVGISVSRVGGSAQIKSMKKVAGTLKIDMAQYRELESFSKFSSDMDAVTAMTLDRGRKNDQLLIQPQYHPMPVGEQVAILYCGVHGLMHEVPMTQVRECQDQFLDAMRSQHSDVIATLADGKLTDDAIKVIEETMANVAGQYKA